MNYGVNYDMNLKNLRRRFKESGKTINMFEIGVQSGGSTRIWRKYFNGFSFRYTGLDIADKCSRFANKSENITIVIGDQTDREKLNKICRDFGPFDFVIDDGGHTTSQIMTTLDVMWKCLVDGAVYAIEDLHTMRLGIGAAGCKTSSNGTCDNDNGSDVYGHMADWMRMRSTCPPLEKHTPHNHPSFHLSQMYSYDSLLFLHYKDNVEELQRFQKGTFI
jgi:hypothetical protein